MVWGRISLRATMRYLMIAILTWSSLEQNVQGNLLETAVEGASRFPPYYPPYSPYFPRPECFPQPAPPIEVECEPCVAPEPCTCEPVLQACQTYTITVCPSPIQIEPIVEVEPEPIEVVEPEVVVERPIIEYPPVTPFIPQFPGFNSMMNFQYSRPTIQEHVAALRSLGDDEK